MNKKIAILGCAVMAMLASCSSDEDVLAGVGNNPADDNTPVEIRLGSVSKASRASVESDENGVFEAEGLGIFCLAQAELGVNPVEDEINWADNAVYSAWMNNVEANAVKTADGLSTSFEWVDGEKRYYPIANWYRYTFYGYYPRQEYVNVYPDQCTVDFVIDGTQDILWGRTNSNDSLAYCAKYFRRAEHKDDVPSIEFKHRLMRLTFSTVAGPDADGLTDAAKTMRVHSIKLKQVPTRGTLVVADKNNPANEGNLTFVWDYDLMDMPLVMSDSDRLAGIDYLSQEIYVADEETKLGQGLLVPVPADSSYVYKVEITLKNNKEEVFVAEHPLHLRNSAVYEDGKSYNVKLTINGPKLIEVKGTLEQWIEDDTTIGDVEL